MSVSPYKDDAFAINSILMTHPGGTAPLCPAALGPRCSERLRRRLLGCLDAHHFASAALTDALCGKWHVIALQVSRSDDVVCRMGAKRVTGRTTHQP